MPRLPIYLDHNATTPCDPAVVEIMLPYFTEDFGNAASRNHSFGWKSAAAVELAREQVAALLGAEPQEIVFTSGATEAANLAIKGVAEAYASKGDHIITCATEHKAVLDTCRHLEKRGVEVSYLPVDKEGRIDVAKVADAITSRTILIAVMYANNETGTLQPVRQIGALARERGVLFFTDATQAIGKIPVNLQHDPFDLLALSAHKFYGPKGIGALYLRRRDPRVRLTAQMDGGGHERGWRSGTLNVPGIAGLGKACELAMAAMEKDALHTSQLRERLELSLLALGDVQVNGSREFRLPHTSNLSFGRVNGEALIAAVNKDIAVSSGSACSSASLEPSYVLKAMGLSDELAWGSIRFGLGKSTTVEEIDYVVTRFSQALKELRG